jgi:hypothetical protein
MYPPYQYKKIKIVFRSSLPSLMSLLESELYNAAVTTGVYSHVMEEYTKK